MSYRHSGNGTVSYMLPYHILPGNIVGVDVIQLVKVDDQKQHPRSVIAKKLQGNANARQWAWVAPTPASCQMGGAFL
jgi:hypothetical protein